MDHCMSVMPKHALVGVNCAMIDHQTIEVKQTMTQTFTLKVQEKDWKEKTSSEKLTLTCVNMHICLSAKWFHF